MRGSVKLETEYKTAVGYLAEKHKIVTDYYKAMETLSKLNIRDRSRSPKANKELLAPTQAKAVASRPPLSLRPCMSIKCFKCQSHVSCAKCGLVVTIGDPMHSD
jgi:hypothetical protein